MSIVTEPRRCGGLKRNGAPCRIILHWPGREKCGQHGGVALPVDPALLPCDDELIAKARDFLDRREEARNRVDPPPLGPVATKGFVYFIGAPDDGPIKIGSTMNLMQRLGSIQSCSPVLLKLLAAFPTDCRFGDERRYHRMFGDLRLHGEWFERDPALLACIEKINQGVRA